MTSMSTIIERAYRKIGVVAADDAMTADQASSGIAALNDMMQAWPLDGIYATTPVQELPGDWPLDEVYIQPTIYLLATRLAEDSGVQVLFDPDPYRRQLQAAFPKIVRLRVDPLLSRLGRDPARGYWRGGC